MLDEVRVNLKNEPDIWLHIIDGLPPGTKYRPVRSGSTKHEIIFPDGKVHFRALHGEPAVDNISFENYIKFNKLPETVRISIYEDAMGDFIRTARGRSYTPSSNPLPQFEENSIPRSNDGNGITPNFEGLELFFQPPPPPGVLGNGNILSDSDYTESIAEMIEKITNSGGQATVPIMGTKVRETDYRNFFIEIGMNPKDGLNLMTALDLTLHHIDNLSINFESTMQLVRREAHRADIIKIHSGSVSQMKKLFKKINDHIL